MRRLELGDDLVERQRRGVDDAGARRGERDDLARHQRTRIEADRAARDEVAPAHGDEVRGARAGADEMDGHDGSPETAMAQVTLRLAMRAWTSRDVGPAPASAAVSATLARPVSATTLSDRRDGARLRRLHHRPRG